MVYKSTPKANINNYLNITTQKMLRLRKARWSTPSIMTAFILICMFLIYGMENLGLTNKDKNLLFREKIPERIINHISTKRIEIVQSNETSALKEKTKEEMNKQMLMILTSGVVSQLDYLVMEEIGLDCEEKQFFDL
jgi:hypothetical protein